MSVHLRFQAYEKEAFMLHLNLHCCRHFQRTSEATPEKELNDIVFLVRKTGGVYWWLFAV